MNCSTTLKLVLLSALVVLSFGMAMAEENADMNESDVVDEAMEDAPAVEELAEVPTTIIISNLTATGDDEFVELTNNAAEAFSLMNWTLMVGENTTFSLPEYTLEPSMMVMVHFGVGEDSETDLFLMSETPVLDDMAGNVTLNDEAGNVVDEFFY